MPWVDPLPKSKRGTAFGVKDKAHPNGHRGSDRNGVKVGTKILAVNDGTIVLSKWSDILGNVTVLKTVLNGKARFWGFCHMDKPGHKVGSIMKAGEPVGVVGNTGSATSGAHLHWTLGDTKDSVFVGAVRDPEVALKKLQEQDKNDIQKP